MTSSSQQPWVTPTTLGLSPADEARLGCGVVRLVPLKIEYAPALWDAVGGTPESALETLRYHPWQPPRSEAEMRATVEARLAAQAQGGGGNAVGFCIVHRHEPAWPGLESLADERGLGKPIGSTMFLDIQPANRSLEIGATWVGPRWRRTRVNTECKYLLLRHAFEGLGDNHGVTAPRLDLHPAPHAEWLTGPGALRVSLRGDGRNQRSLNAVKRIGAAYEGTHRRSRIVWDGVARDTWYCSVIREEWTNPGGTGGVKERLEGLLRG